MTKYITTANGIRFYIERARDFDDAGRMVDGRGWFAGLVVGKDQLSGSWFETYDGALAAIADYSAAV